MEVRTIKDYAQAFSGYAFSSEDLVDTGHPVLKIGNIQNHHILKETESFYKKDITDKLKKYQLQKGDFLIAMTGAGSVGRAGKMVNFEEGYLVNQRVAIIRPDLSRTDPDYLFYYFSMGYVEKYLYNLGIGAGQPNISANDILKTKVSFPDLTKQKKIGEILSTYDELVENNNKRIKLLEQMAENLYKEWFVRRRNPAWEYIRLSDFGYSLESGSRPKGGIDASLQDGYPSLGAEAIGRLGEFDFSSTKLVPEDFYKKMKRGIGKDKDILLYKDGAYIGKVTLFMDEFPYKDYSINEHVFLMRSNEPLYQYYLYFTLALPQYFTQMQNLNRNAAQPGLTGKDIDTLKLYSPDEDTIRKFNSAIEPMMHNIFSLAKKNQILIKQRDLLLPRLMSGKLEV